jgi:hypothetical protein
MFKKDYESKENQLVALLHLYFQQGIVEKEIASL